MDVSLLRLNQTVMFVSLCVPFGGEVQVYTSENDLGQGQNATAPRSSLQKSFSIKLPVITLSLSQCLILQAKAK